MIERDYNVAVDVAKLHDELVAAIPALATAASPPHTYVEPRLCVLGGPDGCQLQLVDGTDLAAVAAVVAQHNPTPTPAPLEPGTLVTHAGGIAIVTGNDPAAGTVTVAPLAAPSTVPSTDVTAT